MRKIRLGNDIIISWHINDENGDPYNLEGKDLYVELSTDKTIVPMQNYQVIGNTIIFPFYGKDQTTTGNYVALLSENKGQIGMKTLDTKKAFTLVAHTWQTGGGDSSEMTVETLDLTGVISGITVTEIYSTIAENYYNKEEVDAKMLPKTDTLAITIPNQLEESGETSYSWADFVELLGLTGDMAAVSYWRNLVELSKTTRIVLNVKIKAVLGYNVYVDFTLPLTSAYKYSGSESNEGWYLKFGLFDEDRLSHITSASVGFGMDLTNPNDVYLTVKCIEESP